MPFALGGFDVLHHTAADLTALGFNAQVTLVNSAAPAAPTASLITRTAMPQAPCALSLEAVLRVRSCTCRP
jgi:hypothetical protein